MDWLVFVIFGAIAALVVGLIALSLWHQKKRTEAWRQVAGDLGIDFRGDQSDLLARCGQMAVFSRGSSRRLTNAISGDAGDVRITLGDFLYTTGSGKNRQTQCHTICVLESDQLHVPHCYLRPEVRFFDALGAVLGGQDVDFSDDPEFSRAYVLQGDSEAAVRERFDADVRAWFAARRGRNFHFEARGNTLVFHLGTRRAPGEARQLMQQALEVLKLLAKE